MKTRKCFLKVGTMKNKTRRRITAKQLGDKTPNQSKKEEQRKKYKKSGFKPLGEYE